MFDVMERPVPERNASKPLRYRAMVLDADGHVTLNVPLPVHSDDAAKTAALQLAEGSTVEVWEGLRLVEHFERGKAT